MTIAKAKHAAYMRRWNRSPAGRAYYQRNKKRRAKYNKRLRETNYERYHAREIAYQTSERGKGKAADRQKRWAKENPERRAAIIARYRATEKGKLHRWSHGAKQRCREANHHRPDGRVKKRPGGDITAKQLRELWRKQDGRCVLTGRPMILLSGKHNLDAPSVDRIDQKRPYTMSNIRIVTYQANCARLFGSDEQLRQFCRDVLRA